MERLLVACAVVSALAGTLIVIGYDVVGGWLILAAFIVALRVMSRTPHVEMWREPLTDHDDESLATGRRRAGEGRIE